MSVLRVLHLEDNSLDADLVRFTLEEDQLPCVIERVSNQAAFEQALRSASYDIILSDFSIPGFDGLGALNLAQEICPEIPFLFLSGTIGEERAVESLKKGAVDYILKDRLQRLSMAMLRARREALNRVERRRHEEKILQQAELLNQARDAIFVRDLDQKITYWNKAAERIYGWRAQEVLGQRASDLLYRQGAPRRDDIWKCVLEKGEWSGELAQVTKDGRDLFISSRRTLLRDAGGQPLAVLNINTDITERKTLETQILRSQRMDSIGALAGGIAHDLNNVLAPILMATEILREHVRTEDNVRVLDLARDSANRGAALVKQILQFARGARGEAEELNLNLLIEDVAKLSSKTFPLQIDIRTDLARDLWPVAGDPTQLHQILLNLCVNARDAMGEKGLLSIRTKNVHFANRAVPGRTETVSGWFVEMAVSDTGTGIAPEHLGRIFEPFYTTKVPDKGTGLGLSTVATIVRNHQGFIEIDTAVGHGATFRIYLPAARKTLTKAAEAARGEPSFGKGEWILLVDDEQAVLQMTKGLLEANGYRVITAESGPAALAAFQSHPEKISVVITDLLMPGVGGQELISNITSQFPGTMTICLSGSADDEGIRSDQTGAFAFLRKPCPTAQLLSCVARALGR